MEFVSVKVFMQPFFFINNPSLSLLLLLSLSLALLAFLALLLLAFTSQLVSEHLRTPPGLDLVEQRNKIKKLKLT
jgi:uncharacterized membrane protein